MRVLPMWKRKSVLTIWPGLPLMIALLLGLWGCASVIEGTSQSISVDTVPAGASCKFVRENVVVRITDGFSLEDSSSPQPLGVINSHT